LTRKKLEITYYKGISAADIIFSAITIIKKFETSYNANGRVRYNLFTGFPKSEW
jgi:hypothetical protein